MFPTLALRNKAMELLAADTATLAPAANANKMILVKATFNPGEPLTMAQLTEADFPGYAAIDIVLATQAEGLDPATLDSIIDILPPAGGFRWETTGAWVTDQTIYGYAVVNNAKTTVFMAARFATPILLTGVSQRIDDLEAELRLPANSMS